MVCAMPVFLLAGLVTVVDGLGQRDLRRFGGGRGTRAGLPLSKGHGVSGLHPARGFKGRRMR